MRIGIITHWTCNENYGQQLQCYALQAYLRSKKHSPFLIKYNNHGKRENKFIKAMREPSEIIPYIKRNFYKIGDKRQKIQADRKFRQFQDKHIVSTQKVYSTYDQLAGDEIDADAYITGSDQVWHNISLDDNGKPWFLEFGRKEAKRISYAASFSEPEVPGDLIRFMRPLLKKFNGVGVREISGLAICARAGRADAVHVVDPTFLLCKEDYLNSFKDEIHPRRETGNFAFLYFLRGEMDIPWGEIRQLCVERHLKEVFTSVHTSRLFPSDVFYNPTIPDWVNTINQANIVFTNSFHGICFSIIMRRPFVAFFRKGRSRTRNDRINSLLTTLGLESRVYTGGNVPLSLLAFTPIDWVSVENRLGLLKDSSLAFLHNNGI